MSGCGDDWAHTPHSWRDGPEDWEWCSGRPDEVPLTQDEIESYEAAEDADDLYARGGYDDV